MNNPMQAFKNMMGVLNPQQFVNNIFAKQSNPMLNNLKEMAQKGDTQGVENFARNLFKEQGRDFDKEFSEFMGNFKK